MLTGAPASSSASAWWGKPSERGGDVFTVLGLLLVEAVTGVQKVVTINVAGSCPGCQVRYRGTYG